jgi:hypothetical protein
MLESTNHDRSFERPFPSTIKALGKAQIQVDGVQIQLGFAKQICIPLPLGSHKVSYAKLPSCWERGASASFRPSLRFELLALRCSSRLRHRLAEEAVGSEEVIALQRPRPIPARRPCRGVDRSSKVHLVEAAGWQPGQRSRCSAASFRDFPRRNVAGMGAAAQVMFDRGYRRGSHTRLQLGLNRLTLTLRAHTNRATLYVGFA